jgi:hypothetical protein
MKLVKWLSISLATLASGALSESSAWAQYIGPGSTLEGDYLRGVGIAAYGMGVYNERTAVADQINANTFMTLNDYMWNVVKNENRENWEHRKQVRASHSEGRKKIEERIHDHPEAFDLKRGDALTTIMNDLWDPRVSDSASRYAQVPLDPDVIRRIPFKLGEKGTAFSMSRLSVKDPKKWAVAFQDPSYAAFRRDYQNAVDRALDLAMEGKMTQKALDALKNAVDGLEDKMVHAPNLLDPTNQKQVAEARAQVDNMRKTTESFMIRKMQPIFAEIDSYSGTTVDDLRLFMRRHGLTFAEADTPDEKTLYPGLYTALNEQRRKSISTEK